MSAAAGGYGDTRRVGENKKWITAAAAQQSIAGLWLHPTRCDSADSIAALSLVI